MCFPNQLGGELIEPILFALGIAVFETDILALDIAALAQDLLERFQVRLVTATDEEHSDAWNFAGLLRLGGEPKGKSKALSATQRTE